MAELRWLVPLFLAVSSILAIVANSLLLLVFFKRRGLRTVSNRFVINLLVTNVLSGIVLTPSLIINTSLDKTEDIKDVETLSRNISEVMVENDVIIRTKLIESEEFIEISILNNNENNCFCYFSQIVTNLVCVASIFGILLIAFDQYFAVIHPLRYHTFINKSKSLILLITTWIFNLLISILNLMVFEVSFWRNCNKNGASKNDVSRNDVSKNDILEVIFAYFYFLMIFLIPFLIICSVYFKICSAAHQNSERMRKSLSNNQLIIKNQVKSKSDDLKPSFDEKLPRVHSAPNIPNLSIKEPKITRSISDRATSNNIIVTLKSKISNASVFKYREETRTAKISILVIFMVLICYFPYGVTIILNVHLKNNPPINFNFVSIILLIISNIISPFLFAYRSKRVQRELFKMFFPKFLRRNRVIKKEFEPFIKAGEENLLNKSVIPKVVVTSSRNDKNENDRWGSGKNWKKKCNFIPVPDSCLEARCSFSSASTQISSVED